MDRIALKWVLKNIRKGEKGKVSRDAFLYLEPKEPKDQFAQCATCIMFTGSGCTILGKDVKVAASDSCGLYVHGEPATDQKGKEEALVTPDEAGLVHRAVRCTNCKWFNESQSTCDLYDKLNKEVPQMFDLDIKVNKYGCCNANT